MSHFDHCGSDMCPASSRVSCACSCARCMQGRPIDDDRVCGMPASSCKAEVARLRAALERAMEVCHREWLHEHFPCAMCEVVRAALGRAAT